MNCSTARTGRPQSCTLWALLLFGCLCRWVSAIVCEIHARDGLEEVVAATAAVAAERQMLMHLVPLCRVPYLVNSPLQPRDLFHVGVEEGGSIELDIHLLPGPYKNTMPSRQPRFRERAAFSPLLLSSSSLPSSLRPRTKEAASSLSGQPSSVASDLAKAETLSAHSSRPSSSARALFDDATASPLTVVAEEPSASTRRLEQQAELDQQAPPQRLQEETHSHSSSWLWAAAEAAAGGLPRLLRDLAESMRFGEDAQPQPLLLSSLGGRSARRSSTTGKEGAKKTLVAAASGSEPLLWRSELVLGGDLSKQEEGCSGAETGSCFRPAVSRRLIEVGEEVYPLNNTYVLLLNHAQLYFLEASETWSQSFTAPGGLVLNSYVPSLLRLPLTGPRLRAKVKAPRHDRYSLVLLNGDGLDLRLEGSVSFWGPTQKHLSLEQLYLPQTECFLMVLHIAAALAVLLLQRFKWRRESRFLSFLFTAYYLLSAVVFGFDYAQSLHVQEVGRRPAALWLLSRLMRKFQDVAQLLVFLFVALGYSITRDRLSRLEIRFVVGVSVISIYLGGFEIIIGGFQEARYVLHVACFVRVLIAIHSNITSLQGSLSGSSLSPSISDLYYKLRAYKNFRRLFFIFLFKPVFSIFFKLSFLGPTFDQLMSWDEWLFVLAENLADFFVISGICYYFCPPRPLKVLQLATREPAETDAIVTHIN